MALSPEQQQAIDAQKAQCPFCKIVRGEIEARKVHDDAKFIGILDINPGAKGHVLFMPKEHYPILPLIPPDIFKEMALKIRQLCRGLKQGVVVNSTNIFIANGAAAGQQSQHFMVHLIPREENDGLNVFDLPSTPHDTEKYSSTFATLKRVLPGTVREQFKRTPIPGVQLSIAYTKEELLRLIEQNPPLKKYIVERPEEFKRQVPSHPQLKPLFENIDVDEIINEFKAKNILPSAQNQQPSPTLPSSSIKPSISSSLPPSPSLSATYSDDQLFEILDTNPMLKDMLLNNMAEFKQQVAEVPRLREIFGGVDLEILRDKLKQREEGKQQDEPHIDGQKKSDLDLISRLAEYGM